MALPSRRAFLKTSATLSSGILLGFRLPAPPEALRPDARRRGRRGVRAERLHPHQQGQRGHRHREQGRDGPGHLDLAPDADRRGAGGRPATDQGRGRAGRSGLCASRLRPADDGRQHEHRERVGAPPQGRRGRSRDAPRGRGGRVEGRPREPARGERRRARAGRPAAHLRAARRAGRDHAGPGGPAPQAAVGVEAHRQGHAAPRQPREGHRRGHLRDGRHAPGHADGPGGPPARLRRHRQAGRRRPSAGGARREGGGPGPFRRGGDRHLVLGREAGARRPPRHLGGGRRRPRGHERPRGRVRQDWRRRPDVPCGARGTRTAPCSPRPRGSPRATRRRTSPTRPWSR